MSDFGFNWSESSLNRNRLTGIYEPLQPLILLKFIETHKCTHFLDIGANIGFYSLLMTSCKDIQKVFSIEAAPVTFKTLEANIKLNKLSNKIQPINCAVSNLRKKVNFMIESSLSGINSIEETNFHNKNLYSESIEIETVTVDELCNFKNKLLALKIDVEGHETQVLDGARELLSKNKCIVQVESYIQNKEKVFSLFYDLGYKSILSIKDDHFFSNIDKIENETILILQDSISFYIDILKKDVLFEKKSILDLVNNSTSEMIIVESIADKIVFDAETEYAFYIYGDGEIVHKTKYMQDNCFSYKFDSELSKKNLVVTSFVRSKENYEIKMKTSIKIC